MTILKFLCEAGKWRTQERYSPCLSKPGQSLPTILNALNFYRPQTKFAKVMFLHVSVSDSVHRGGGIPACLVAGLQGGWYPSMPCRFPGPHPGGSWGVWPGGWRGLQAHTQGGSWGGWPRGPTPRGVYRPTPGGCVSHHALRQSPTPRRLLLRGGTHPTGMYSFLWYIHSNLFI